MNALQRLTKALADPSRMDILCFLKDGELCACQITVLLKRAGSTVSRHLAELERAGLIVGRKDGRWIHYHRADSEATPEAAELLEWVDRHAPADRSYKAKQKELAAIRKKGPTACCRDAGAR